MLGDISDRGVARLVFAFLLLMSAGYLGVSQATDQTRSSAQTYFEQAELPMDEREPVVPTREAATVVTSRGAQQYPGTDALYVFGANGTLRYFENRTRYADVDPSPAGSTTLQVAADKRVSTGSDQMIRQINYSTGATTDVFRINTPGDRDSNWHDVDRIGPNRYVVAGIWHDNVWVVNSSSGVRTWEWGMQAEFNTSSGGPYPSDWAHMNDVERLPDGRFMVSPRNHDQVLFIDPETGLQEDWTLGCDDCLGTLYEQHNPDYIPKSQGGPAVLIADSENNRVVEYQRENGSWRLSWVWQSEHLDWPRDADRLPNGNTLITSTHGDRVIEVNESGDIVWKIHVPNGYEAERLGTGDESEGGPSAVRANLTNRTADGNSGTAEEYANEAERAGLTKALHGLQFVIPSWMGFLDLLFALEGLGIILVWGCLELRWLGIGVRWPMVYGGRGDKQ